MSLRRRTILGALIGACALSSIACDDEPPPRVDDGGTVVDGPDATGRIQLATSGKNLPALLSVAELHLGAMELHNDRGEGSQAVLSVTAPLDLADGGADVIEAAIPATYGAVRLVELDTLELRTVAGLRVVVELGALPPIELRCPGAGATLSVGGGVDVGMELDWSGVIGALSVGGAYPPLLPLQTITDGALVADVYDALLAGLSTTCAALP